MRKFVVDLFVTQVYKVRSKHFESSGSFLRSDILVGQLGISYPAVMWYTKEEYNTTIELLQRPQLKKEDNNGKLTMTEKWKNSINST